MNKRPPAGVNKRLQSLQSEPSGQDLVRVGVMVRVRVGVRVRVRVGVRVRVNLGLGLSRLLEGQYI